MTYMPLLILGTGWVEESPSWIWAYLLVCVRVRVWCACVCACGCALMRASCEGLRTTPAVVHLSVIHLLFLKIGSLSGLKITRQASLASQKHPEICLSPSTQHSGYKSVCHHTWLIFRVFWGLDSGLYACKPFPSCAISQLITISINI